ncbi:MAG: hypothetical protein ACSW8D_14695 [Prevotella sp.]
MTEAMAASAAQMPADGSVTASVTVKNTGNYDADFDIMIGSNSRDVKKKSVHVRQ